MKDSGTGNQIEIAKGSEMLKGGRKQAFELQTELHRKEAEIKKKEVESQLRETKRRNR